MTSPSKSRLLQDIRYFESVEAEVKSLSSCVHTGTIFLTPKEAISLGQRIGRKCGELGISIGDATHLYLCFTSALPEKNIVLADFTFARWQKYVSYGLSPAFNECSDELKLNMLVDATIEVLERIGSPVITSPQQFKRHVLNESLLLLVKNKNTIKYNVEIYQTIPVHPRRAEVFAHILQNKTGIRKEVKIGTSDFYNDVPGMADRISISKEILTILPRKSLYLNLQLPPVNLENLFS